ncbi:MAG: DMT family transporter, partial [Anaerolineales bacterium]|nr:DMT family transporter [Anaerolineales bacterium]
MLVAQRGREQLDTFSFFWLTAAVGSVLLLIFCLAVGAPLTGYSQQTYIYLLMLGLFVQGGGWMLLNYAQGHLPASMVSPTLLSQPILTAIIAGPILGEWLSRGEWLGALAVLLGVVIVHRSRVHSVAAAK